MGGIRVYRANGTILRSRFCKLDTTAGKDQNVIACSAVNDKAIGITTDAGYEAPIPSYTADPPEAAIAGGDVRVHTNGSECLLEIGSGGVTQGDYITSDNAGKGVKNPKTGHPPHIGAIALRSAAAGELCLVQVAIFDSVAAAFT